MDQNDEIEIDLIDMCKYILSKWVFILLGMILCAGAAFGFAKLKRETVYISTMKLYVTVPKTSDKVLIRDDANELAADYLELINTDLVTEKIAKRTGIEKEKIKGVLTAEQVEGTRMITVTAKTDNAKDTKEIASATLKALTDTITKDLKKDQPIVVEESKAAQPQQSLSIKKYMAVGATGGFVLTAGIFFISYLVQIDRRERSL